MVIIPEICITQVSGIIRTFAADMRKIILTVIMLAMTTVTTNAQNVQNKAAENSTLQLVLEWDKTFPKSDKVRHEKVTFRNRFGITLAADLYMPKGAKGNRRTSERRAELAPAIPSEEEEGKSQSNEWLEPVSDEEYQRIHQ